MKTYSLPAQVVTCWLNGTNHQMMVKKNLTSCAQKFTQFNFVKKDSVQRLKLLTIRPFASRKYANDLTVKAILRLSKTKIFKQLEIKIVGDGKLFDEIIEPLHKFDNITIDRGFLSHAQIADLHKQYGVFLTPTRTLPDWLWNLLTLDRTV